MASISTYARSSGAPVGPASATYALGSTIATTVASVGTPRVASSSRAAAPWATSTRSPSPAPTPSTATNSPPPPSAGVTRRSLKGVSASSLTVATVFPVTRHSCMVSPSVARPEPDGAVEVVPRDDRVHGRLHPVDGHDQVLEDDHELLCRVGPPVRQDAARLAQQGDRLGHLPLRRAGRRALQEHRRHLGELRQPQVAVERRLPAHLQLLAGPEQVEVAVEDARQVAHGRQAEAAQPGHVRRLAEPAVGRELPQ